MKNELYYTKVSAFEEKYTEDSSSGKISVEQIIKGKRDIFINNAPEEHFTQKKILVRDWFLSTLVLPNYYNDIKEKKLSLYRELQNKGFEIYGYIDGHLKKIHNVEELTSIQFRSEKETQEDAGKLGFTKDEIYIAGPMESLKLLKLKEYNIDVQLLNALSSNLKKEFLKELNNKGDIKIKCNINSITLEYILANPEEEIGSYVDHLSFSYIIEIDNLNKIFKNCPNIKVLNFENRFWKVISSKVSEIKLPSSVARLNLSKTEVTFQDLNLLTENCPNLTIVN
ncbi:hypothetical protein NOVO_07715 [Rickettsiales bacterium Ac37b]|nr:hypothetical protein NOVO_07715 [Rickettsiales bacterium Ac37b]